MEADADSLHVYVMDVAFVRALLGTVRCLDFDTVACDRYVNKRC